MGSCSCVNAASSCCQYALLKTWEAMEWPGMIPDPMVSISDASGASREKDA